MIERKRKCGYCRLPGHTARTCINIRRDEEKDRRDRSDLEANLLTDYLRDGTTPLRPNSAKLG